MSFSRGFRTFGRAIVGALWKPQHSKKYITAGICALCGLAIAEKCAKNRYYFVNYNNVMKELQASATDVSITPSQKNDEQEDQDEVS